MSDRLCQAADTIEAWTPDPTPSPRDAALANLLRAVDATADHVAGTPEQAASVVLAQAAAHDLAAILLGNTDE